MTTNVDEGSPKTFGSERFCMLGVIIPDMLLFWWKALPLRTKRLQEQWKGMAGLDVHKDVFRCSYICEEDAQCVSGCSALRLVSDINCSVAFVGRK